MLAHSPLLDEGQFSPLALDHVVHHVGEGVTAGDSGRCAVHTQEAEDSASQLGHLEGTRGKENLAISSPPYLLFL